MAARTAEWGVRILAGLALLVTLAAAGLWWWSGQEGSLEWLLRRIGGSLPVQTEGVQGAFRGQWHIQRVVWEKDGLQLEARDIELDWDPTALLRRTLRLEAVRVASVRITDKRAATQEPLKPPSTLRLPWRVAVDELAVRRLEYRGRTDVDASRLTGRYAFDGLRHRADLHSLQLAGGTYRGEGSLFALPPFTLDAKLSGRFTSPVPGSEAKLPLEFQLRAGGPAARIDAKAWLHVTGHRSAELPQATATASITPFETMPLPQAAADFQHLDLALLWPAAPRTSLSGRAEIVPEGKADWRLSALVANAAAGPWDAGQLPVHGLRAEGEWRKGTALVRTLRAAVGGGTVEGAGRWHGDGWRFDGRIAGVDPSQVHRSLAALPLTGPVKMEGAGKAIDFDVAVQAGPARASKAGTALAQAAGALELRDVLARGRWEGEALSLPQLRVRTGDAQAEGQLEVNLAQRAGSGKLQLRAPGLAANAQGSVAETKGDGKADAVATDLAAAQRWLARWPGMAALLKNTGVRGQAQAQLAWQGGWRDPAVQARATARSVSWQAAARAGQPEPLPWSLRDAQVQVQGRLRDASVELRALAERGQRKVDVAAAGRVGGSFSPAAWHGNVASASAQLQDPSLTPGPWRVQLQRAVDWRLAGGRFELSGGEALLRAPALRSGAPATDAVLTWAPVRRERGLLSTSGRLAGLPMAWIELLGGPQLAGSALSGDMVFDAQWNAQLGNTVRVDASLARVRGDVTVLAESLDGAAARVTAGVRDARITVSTQGEQLVFSLLWDSERAGRAEGQVRTRLVRDAGGGWDWPEQAPVSGRLRAQLPRIGVWSLLAPPGWRLRGSLDADVAIAGTRGQPELSGPVNADDLALRSVVDGIELRHGRLRAQLAGRKLVVNEFMLRGSDEGGGGGGTLLAFGEGVWTPQGAAFEAHAQLSQLRASIRSDRQLTVSGPLTARMDRNGTTVTGELVVDRARIQIPDEAPPRLGDDVVVRNAPGVAPTEAERKQRPAPSEVAGRTVTLRVSVDLGPDFRVSGRGLDTRLAGTVQVQGASLGVPQMTGVIRTAGGTYQAYGQQMKIDRGELRFTGTVDNPALDILAIRPNLTQKVGVLVTGRAQSPHVELYSDGGLSDAETLSYLVLGRSSAGGGAEAALLQRAATALLAGRGGTGKGIAGRLGLDDISVSPDSTSGAVMRVGKRFGENFYAAYERSLSGAMGTLFIFYDVSRRVTVRAEAGERTGLDLIFTFAFDGPGRKRQAATSGMGASPAPAASQPR